MIQCHFEISGIRKDGGYDSGLNHGDIAIMCPLERVFFLKICATQVLPTGETVLKVKAPPVRIENSLSPLYRGTDFSTLAETFKTVWGGGVANGTFSSGLNN